MSPADYMELTWVGALYELNSLALGTKALMEQVVKAILKLSSPSEVPAGSTPTFAGSPRLCITVIGGHGHIVC